MKAFLHSRRDLDVHLLRRQFEEGLRLEPAPYGFRVGAEMPDVMISYSRSWPETKLDRWIFRCFGFDPMHAIQNLKRMRDADVIWTVLEWEWMGASFLQRLGLLQQKPIIGNNVFLAQEFVAMSRSRKGAYRFLMSDRVFLTVHSKRAASELSTWFPKRTFHLLHFGISTLKFPVTPPRPVRAPGPLRVYSIGGDKGRDWVTFLKAFGNDHHFEVRVVAKRLHRDEVAEYKNVQFADSLTEAEERENYLWADVVVVAMYENLYSGITVMCEAAACGVPIIATRTGGADTYFDDAEVFYVGPGDVDDLRAAALSQSQAARVQKAEAAQARFRTSGYASEDMVGRYVARSRDLLRPPEARRRSGRRLEGS